MSKSEDGTSGAEVWGDMDEDFKDFGDDDFEVDDHGLTSKTEVRTADLEEWDAMSENDLNGFESEAHINLSKTAESVETEETEKALERQSTPSLDEGKNLDAAVEFNSDFEEDEKSESPAKEHANGEKKVKRDNGENVAKEELDQVFAMKENPEEDTFDEDFGVDGAEATFFAGDELQPMDAQSFEPQQGSTMSSETSLDASHEKVVILEDNFDEAFGVASESLSKVNGETSDNFGEALENIDDVQSKVEPMQNGKEEVSTAPPVSVDQRQSKDDMEKSNSLVGGEEDFPSGGFAESSKNTEVNNAQDVGLADGAIVIDDGSKDLGAAGKDVSEAADSHHGSENSQASTKKPFAVGDIVQLTVAEKSKDKVGRRGSVQKVSIKERSSQNFV